MLQFKDKKVLVTGGSRGIGESIAVAFARSGARVAINYRANEKAAASCVRKLTGKGHIA
jgi:3-oxoacyl-[acyl-carrier protein] reductase